MIGDTILITQRHIEKAEYIVREIYDKISLHEKFILAIGGESGTGKTEISTVLQQKFYKLKIRSIIVHIDDYYRIDPELRDKRRKETGIIGKDEVDWDSFNDLIKAFISDQFHLRVKEIHKYINSFAHIVYPNTNIDILIIDGLYANFVENKTVGIYLEGSIKETEQFRRARGKENPDDPFRRIVLEKERNCVVQSRRLADIIIPYNFKLDEGKF